MAKHAGEADRIRPAVIADASQVGLGIVLQRQHADGGWITVLNRHGQRDHGCIVEEPGRASGGRTRGIRCLIRTYPGAGSRGDAPRAGLRRT